MLLKLFPIFNFNIPSRQSQRVCSGFLLIEASCALSIALFVFLIFAGAFVSWLTYAQQMQRSAKACLYAQTYADSLFARGSLRFIPYRYEITHEGYLIRVGFYKDPQFSHFIHSVISLHADFKHDTVFYELYTGYIY